MYYTTSGAYRKTKMVIDYVNIALTAVIVVLFILILFLRGGSGILFPCIFTAGGLTNGLTGIKNMMDGKRLAGILLLIAALVLFIIAAATGIAVTR